MPRLAPMFASLILSTAAHAASIAPWNRLGSPRGGDVGCFVFDTAHPGVTLAGSNRGLIFRSTDGGVKWKRIAVGRDDEEFRVIGQSTAAPGTFFAYSSGFSATGFSGRLYTSTDDGVTWTRADHQPMPSGSDGGYGRGIAIDRTGQIIVLSDHFSGVLRSTDGGNRWNNPLPGTVARPFGLANDTAHPGTLYLAGETRATQGVAQMAAIWKSTDFGATWVQTTPGALNVSSDPSTALSVVVQPGTGTLLATYEDGISLASGVAKSQDGGSNWSGLNTGLLPSFTPGSATGGIVFDAANPNTIYLSTGEAGAPDGSGFYKSRSDGRAWLPVGNANPFGGGFVAAARPATQGYPAALFVGAPNVEVSTDHGARWAAHPFANAPLTRVADGGMPGVYYGLTATNAVFSTDSGKSWTLAGDWVGSHATQGLAVDLSPGRPLPVVFVATLDNLWRSTDHANWISVKPPGLPTGTPIGSVTTDSNGNLFATTNTNLLYRSADDGSTWTAIAVSKTSDSFAGSTPVVLTDAPAGSPAAGYAFASLTSGLWVSADSGQTWAMTAAQPGSTIASMAVQHVAPNALYLSTFSGVQMTANAGESFSPVQPTVPVNYGLPLLATSSSGPQVYLGYATSDVLLSTDNFASYSNVATALLPDDSNVGLGSLSATASAVFVNDPDGATFSEPYAGAR